MPTNTAQTDPEKLRAFEQRMSNEGAAGFAAGPAPWESWDEPGSAGTWRIQRDTVRAAHRKKAEKPHGQRVLTGITRLAVLALGVGIAGVYFTSGTEPRLATDSIQPAPMATTTKPAGTISPLAGPVERQNSATVDLNALPAPASGRPEIAAVAVTADRQQELPATQTAAASENAPASTSAYDRTIEHVQEIKIETPEQSTVRSGTTEPQLALQEPAAAPVTVGMNNPATEAIRATTAPDSIGPWVVNLAACTRESTARRMLEEFRDKGVTAELVHVTVNEQPMVRIRTSGYRSFREANDWAALLEERLGLDGAWVSKR